MLTHKAHSSWWTFLFIFSIRSLTVVCCSAFASKYHISWWNSYPLCTRIDARCFFFSCQHQTGIDFFVANMENIVHSMQVLNMFNSCTDTIGPFIIPFITCSYKIVKVLIGSRMFTQGSVLAHLCRHRSCLNCHKPNNWNKCQKELSDNCQSDVSCNLNISFSLSSINFYLGRL